MIRRFILAGLLLSGIVLYGREAKQQQKVKAPRFHAQTLKPVKPIPSKPKKSGQSKKEYWCTILPALNGCKGGK